MDGGEVDLVQFVTAEGNVTEALEATEESFDFVAPAIAGAVVGPGPAAVGPGRDDGMVTELGGQAPGGVVFVGAVVGPGPARRGPVRVAAAARVRRARRGADQVRGR